MSELRRITEQYHLDKLIRSSGGGSVFRATVLRSGEVVAVKLLPEEAGEESEEQRDEFLRAAGALKSLTHPSLPRVLDFGFTTAGSAFLVTEFLHGSSLAVFAGSPAPRVLALLLPVAGGLEALAGAGIAHRNLQADNLLVVPGPAGEQVKILGLGAAALRASGDPASLEEGRRADLRAFAAITCELLGAPAAHHVELPPGVAGELAEPAALASLLGAALDQNPDGTPPSYHEVLLVYHLAIGDEDRTQPALTAGQVGIDAAAGDKTMVLADLAPPPPPRPAPAAPAALPSPPPPAPAPPMAAAAVPTPAAPPSVAAAAPAEVTAVRGLAPRRPRGPLLAAAVGGIAVVVLLAVIAAGLALRARRAPAPPSPPPAAAGGERPAAPTLQAPPAAPAPAPLPSPSAEPTPSTQSTESLLPAGDTRRESDLRAALNSGESQRVKAAVGAFRPDERATLPAAARRDLDRGTRALAAADLLDKAEKAGRPGEALHQAGALLALLPRSARAKQARDSAAAALETAADAAAEAGRFDEALQTLASLRAVWPERPGLAERTARAESARKEDQRLETVLAEAARDGQANKPLAGLDVLAGAHPSRRFEPRFKQQQASLEGLLAKLDRNPPTVAIRGPFAREYEKDKSIKIPLQVADDLEVVKVELWVRPEGGMFIPIPVTHLSGADYEAEIPPGVHLNKNVEFYVTASDRSGHQGQLGTPANPQKLKRKSWFSKILGKGEG